MNEELMINEENHLYKAGVSVFKFSNNYIN